MTIRFRAFAGAATISGVAALAFVAPMSASATDTADQGAKAEGSYHATPLGSYNMAGDTEGHSAKKAPPARANTRMAWYYRLESSCTSYASTIQRGAAYWGGTRSTSSGTPVSCTTGYVQGCGPGTIVGCNWGMGDRIALSTRVNDFALLAAHEFGHNWYGHSGTGCASWASASMVMRTHMC
ncbi:hypothetical protein [Spirillospora sp. CA-294931]|uniref:hypothetical protein n=1 Tax=Spirillospora sp. CA-294931 TaxID=3240042 RepID=UPI003D8A4DDD